MKFRNNKNKGFTLIECITYLSISLIVVSIGIKLLIDSKKIFYTSIKENMNLNSIEEAFHMIDVMKIDHFYEITGDIEKNKIIFDKKGSLQKNELCTDKNDLIIKYYDYSGYNKQISKNLLLSNIDNFKVKKKGKLIYIVIKKNGEEYIKCI